MSHHPAGRSDWRRCCSPPLAASCGPTPHGSLSQCHTWSTPNICQAHSSWHAANLEVSRSHSQLPDSTPNLQNWCSQDDNRYGMEMRRTRSVHELVLKLPVVPVHGADAVQLLHAEHGAQIRGDLLQRLVVLLVDDQEGDSLCVMRVRPRQGLGL